MTDMNEGKSDGSSLVSIYSLLDQVVQPIVILMYIQCMITSRSEMNLWYWVSLHSERMCLGIEDKVLVTLIVDLPFSVSALDQV